MRNLREEDHAAVVSVADEWWGGRRVSDKLPRLFFRYFRDTSFVIEGNGELVGFIVGIASPGVKEAYVHFAGVHPEFRGRGIASRLYETFFKEAHRRSCSKVRCITSPVNRGSIAFHRRMGFGILPGDGEHNGVSVHADYDGDGKEKVVFERELR